MTFEQLEELVLKWSSDRNIIRGSTARDQYIKTVSELGELGDAILKNDRNAVEDGVGDALVCLINLCAIMDIPIIYALERAYNEIKDRKGVMFNGVFVKESDENYERIVNHIKRD